MVMKKNIMGVNLFRSIMKSIGRYVAIVAIIALGSGLFVGLLATKSDMIATGQEYLDEQNMFDLRLLNPYGWTDEELAQIKNIGLVHEAEPYITMDVIATLGETGTESVYRLHEIPEMINKVCLRGGRMPAAPNECLADGLHASDKVLGKTFKVSSSNTEESLDSLSQTEFTVVGYVSSPLYMDMNRGSTTLGNGSVSAFVYVMPDVIQQDSYTQIDITLHGDYEIYSDEYDRALEESAEAIKPMLIPLVQKRYEVVYAQAKESLAQGQKELEDGIEEYKQGKLDADRELEAARKQLETAQLEIETNSAKIYDGEKQLKDAQNLINQSELELSKGKSLAYSQLSDASTALIENYSSVQTNLNTVNGALIEVESGLAQLDAGITQLETGLNQLDLTISLTETMIGSMDTALQSAQRALEYAQNQGLLDQDSLKELESRIKELTDQKNEYSQQLEQLRQDRETYAKQLDELRVQREEALKTQNELEESKAMLNDAMDQIQQGFKELENSKLQVEAQFASAEASIQAAKVSLNAQTQELENGKKDLEEGKHQLLDGWNEYWAGADEAGRQLSEAQLEIAQGREKLLDAQKLIESMKPVDPYILDRNTNVGYVALNNNSDIVAGVSKVFPAFFLLVAALVCITTMTRMVEDERTQIGTLKALGYGNFSIVSKYLIYAGSAAIVGCGLGTFVGSIVFPKILWGAYSLIINVKPDIKIVFDLPLCIGVVSTYTVVILLVTWCCCRLILRDVPAELIRPKAPASGKKILLERFTFWNKLRFLDKVMFRNIFRYRQRLLMMLVGIGGCTALLVTGFGLGDSIMDIVSYQFEEVTVYDMQVQFTEGQSSSQKENFVQALSGNVSQICFAHQSSVDVDFGGQTKSLYLIAADSTLEKCYDLHTGNKKLQMPGPDQALLSRGTAESLGVKAGDRIVVRNSNLQRLELTVSGVFDNNVYNYVIVSPETVIAAWGEKPEEQIAYLNLLDGQDAHQVSTLISENADVMNIMISQDLAEQVGSMLQALNSVVVTVVICASLLAIIVVYNLTNINISERIREIATIKVLGFNEVESALYVFKENLLLSAFGAVLGLIGGKFLLDFVMSQIRIDMVWMDARILPLSLVWSVVITILSSLIVDFLLYFKLDKINMAEALKSVE